MDAEIGICEQIRKTREGALRYWRPLHEARGRLRDFLDGKRFEDDDDSFNLDPSNQRFRGQETSNVNRHIAAGATAAPRNLEALPVDKMSDADDAEIAVSVMDWELDNPQKGYADVIECVVQDAVDVRSGCAILDFDPDEGAFGETFWRWKDSGLIMFEPGFDDPHHLQCGWMRELRRMPKADIKRMGKLKGKAKWNVPADLKGDGESLSSARTVSGPDGAIPLGPSMRSLGVPGEIVDDDHVWVEFWWFKRDEATFARSSDDSLIPEGERYMGCDNTECAYRSDSQDELIDAGTMPKGSTLPDTMEPCPECQGTLSRRDVRSKVDDVLIYPRGRRLVIVPLLQNLPGDEPFYDGGWPIPTARSFPIIWVTRYLRPGRPMGDCDTDRNWPAQVASDQLLTAAFERVMLYQRYYGFPWDGSLRDADGNRMEMRPEQFNTFFYDNTNTDQPHPEVMVIEGTPLDGAWPAYWGAVRQTLLESQGVFTTSQIGDDVKSVPVGTIQTASHIGNAPIEHFIRRKNRAIGRGLGVHWDYLRYTYTRARLARLRLGDEMAVERLRGDELPNFDFIISESPPFSGIDKARNEAAQTLIQAAMNTPEWLDVIAEVNNFPPSIVRKVKRQLALKRQAEEQAAVSQATPGSSGGSMLGPSEGPLDIASLLGQGNASPQPSPEMAAA